jgi:hypothetical protein
MVKLYKDGDHTAIITDARTESEFVDELTELLSGLIDEGKYSGDWQFQLMCWLLQVVDICCEYRGYDSPTHKRTMLIAGDRSFYGKEATHTLNQNLKDKGE